MLEGSEDWTNDDPTSERQRQFKIAPRYGQIHFPRRMKHCPERTSKRLIPRRVRRLPNTCWPLLTKRRRSSDAQRQPTKSSGASSRYGCAPVTSRSLQLLCVLASANTPSSLLLRWTNRSPTS